MNPKQLQQLEAALGHRFAKAGLAAEAATHPSCAFSYNNQRLEFLGDTVLALVVANLLYRLFPAEREGDLAKRHAALVRGETLVGFVRDKGLAAFLQLNEGEESCGGRENPANLEDYCEALLGAVYLDGGLESAESVILPYWEPLAAGVKAPPKDPKTALQEWAQARGKPLPTYHLAAKEGPSHAPLFTVEVSVEGSATCAATASTKRVAERKAAKLLLEHLEAEHG